jgi:hypothetical protein
MNETKKGAARAPKSQPYVTNYEEHVMKIDLKMRGKELVPSKVDLLRLD